MDGIWSKKQKSFGEIEAMEQEMKLPWETDKDAAVGMDLFKNLPTFEEEASKPKEEIEQAEEEAKNLEEGMEQAEEEAKNPVKGMEQAEEEVKKSEAETLFRELKEENRDLQREIGTLKEQMTQIGENTQKLASEAEAMARQLNQVNQNLHKENRELKNGLYDSLVLSVVRDVVDVASDMMLDIRRHEKNEEKDAAEALKSSLEDLHAMLKKHGVEAYQVQPGEKYESIRQRVLKAVDTEEKAKDRTVEQATGYGYSFRGEDGTEKILAPCKVIVYKKS